MTLANSGSVGATFYQPFAFVASDHVTKLKQTQSNKYIYLYLATIVGKLGEKYSFNREINDKRLKREYIMLPATENNAPDYHYMEQYMRQQEAMLLHKYINKRLALIG